MPTPRSLTLLATAVAVLGVAATAALGAVPNDTRYPEQWGLRTIGAPPAWDVTTGGAPGVRIAVIDSGVEEDHPDLAPNVGGANPGETGEGREDNGVDDDGNGKIDDWRGWDFVGDDNDPQDTTPLRHGTRVAGVVAARGNNALGITGIAWRAQLIPLRVLGSNEDGDGDDIAAAITYARDLGVPIANLSLGGPDLVPAIERAIAAAPNTLFVVAAGNGGDDDVGDDNDANPFYPCDLPLANIVCVAATNANDTLAPFSNWGATTVDLAAPGDNILSATRTALGYSYSPVSGTSFAAPLVAGTAALVKAGNPGATTQQLRAAILDGVQPLPKLDGRVASGGLLSAAGAVGAVAAPYTPPAAAPSGAPAVLVPVPGVKPPAPARPTAAVRTTGGRWFLTLKLGERTTTSALLQRRAPRAAGRPVRFVTAKGVRARLLKAGIRRIALGALRPGQYRLRIRVVGSLGATTIVRSFRVPPARPKEGATSHVAPGG